LSELGELVEVVELVGGTLLEGPTIDLRMAAPTMVAAVPTRKFIPYVFQFEPPFGAASLGGTFPGSVSGLSDGT
jgi:hypothetical protein